MSSAPWLVRAPAPARPRRRAQDDVAALAELVAGPAEVGFVARYRGELSSRPARLVGACLVTLLAPVLIGATATAGARGVSQPSPPSEQPSTAAALPAPGDAAGWAANARDAAATCPGLSPQVLVAIGHVETRLGQGGGLSAAGARGPMQFLPATWAAYGTDGDGDGVPDIMNPRDALYSAARLLCANGGATAGGMRSALWHYNHSQDYVNQVLRVAGAG